MSRSTRSVVVPFKIHLLDEKIINGEWIDCEWMYEYQKNEWWFAIGEAVPYEYQGTKTYTQPLINMKNVTKKEIEKILDRFQDKYIPAEILNREFDELLKNNLVVYFVEESEDEESNPCVFSLKRRYLKKFCKDINLSEEILSDAVVSQTI